MACLGSDELRKVVVLMCYHCAAQRPYLRQVWNAVENLSDNMRWLNFVCICDKVIIIFSRFFLGLAQRQ